MLTLRRSIGLIVLSLLVAEPPGAAGDGPEDAGVRALVGARILSQSDSGTIDGGTVLIRGDRIEAVGLEVEVPEEADRIDVSGLTLTPGLIDARSVLWLPPESRRDSGNDGGLNILDGVDPFAEDWRDVARSGVTAVAVQPGNTGLFGGRGAVLRVGPGGAVARLTIRPDAFVQAALGVNDSSTNSILRYQQYEQLKRSIEGLKKYKEEWEKYAEAKKKYDEEQARPDKEEADKTEEKEQGKEKEDVEEQGQEDDEKEDSDGSKDDEGSEDEPAGDEAGSISLPQDEEDDGDEPEEGDDDEDQKDGEDDTDGGSKKPAEPPKEPDRDEAKEFLVKLLGGEVPLRIEVHREDDLRNALALAEEFDLRLIVEGLSDPKSAREELVRRRTPMVLGPILELGSRPPYRRSRADSWPSGLLAEDSRWAIGTYGDRPADSALLRAHAAAAVSRGVPADRVLRALTAGAAEVLGLGDELGAVAPGRRADLVAFAGDPLDPSAPVALVVSGGEVVYRDPDVQAPEEVEPVAVVDADLPDRLPSRFVIQSRRLLRPDGSIGPGALSVAEGTIVASGEEIAGADDLPTYDVGDAVIAPGLLTAVSTLGQSRAAAESAGADAGFLRAVDAFDPTGKTVRRLVRGGVLKAGFSPGSVNVVAGAAGAVRLGAIEPVVDPVIGVGLVLSESSRNIERYPASLPGQVALVRAFLGLEGGEDPSARRRLDYYLSSPVIDRLDAIRRDRAEEIRSGSAAALFEAESPAEVEAALDLAETLGVRAVLVGPGAIEEHPARVSRLAGAGALTLVLRPIPPGPVAWRRLEAVAAAAEAGARVLFAAEDPEELRLLAASSVAVGLPASSALRGLAGGFAAIGLPVEGSPASPWEPGAPADFTVWDGSPLDLASRPLAVVVDGRLAP
ncbi:hypothetical protein TsocGM_15915 [Tautonia sociabilis]|uniref:Amidohydrolase-related domain-containing protein n=2 Tax=Tautonia sociabilis TaxID=2080755 RepID=A0A432MHR6_9BACT|nr:hypothetical protein TsocGM_15915 [Tautonia sociabilis]